MASSSEAHGERQLWAAVLNQVLSDAFTTKVGATPFDRRQAISFLIEPVGKWAVDRSIVASFAGLDGEFVRQTAIDIIEGRRPLHLSDALAGSIDLDLARSTYEELRSKSQKNSSQTLPRIVRRPSPSSTGTDLGLSRRWLCFMVDEDSLLLLPRGAKLVGSHNGQPLPVACSFAGRVMREMAKSRGATRQELLAVTKDYHRAIRIILEEHPLDLVLRRDGIDIPNATTDDIDGTTQAFLRLRLPARGA